ncbi:MAG: response regulator with a DNA-binding domain [Bryobacterales bacterium]|nr:response regulator with a DNA-binding domain [Bryobacterales bacterium]
MKPRPWRVLIIDDHEVVRDGIKNILDDTPGEITFGAASTPLEATRLVESQPWDIAILDLSLGQRSGLELLKDLKAIRPQLPVLVLTMHSEEQYARRAFKAGAAGYVTKCGSRAELLKAINKTMAGGRYVSPELAEKLAADLGKPFDGAPHEALSDRELEVLRLIGSGKTLSEIASLLSLSDKTISTYRARILQKMSMKNNSELTLYAIRSKIVD